MVRRRNVRRPAHPPCDTPFLTLLRAGLVKVYISQRKIFATRHALTTGRPTAATAQTTVTARRGTQDTGAQRRSRRSRLHAPSRLSRTPRRGFLFYLRFLRLFFACRRARAAVQSAQATLRTLCRNVRPAEEPPAHLSRDKAVADKTPYSTGPQEVPEEQPVAVPPTPPDRANRCDVVPIKQPGHIAQPHVAHDQDHENEPRTRLVSRQDHNGEKAQRARSGGVKGARECSRITHGLRLSEI
jgi:hypothetical protein